MSTFFKSNLSDLVKVRVGSKSGEGGESAKPDDYKIIPDDEQSDQSDKSDQSDQSDQNEPSDPSGESGKGKGEEKPVDVKIGGNPKPIIDIIPEDSSLQDMFGDAEELAGSDGKSSKPMTREEKKKALSRAEQAEKAEAEANQAPGTQSSKGDGSRRIMVAGDYPIKTDWASILINLLKTKQPGPPSWSQVHKKTFGTKFGGQPVMRPGRTDKPDVGKIIIAMDTSGSIDDVIMNKFVSELRRIYTIFQNSTNFSAKIVLWADGPYAESPDFSGKQFNSLQKWIAQNFKSGGTAIRDVVRLINGLPNLNQYIATVWFTDGQVWDLDLPLPAMDNVFVIQGFSAVYTRDFFDAVKKYRPASKKITVVRTDY